MFSGLNRGARVSVVGLLAALVLTVALFLPPIPQDLEYHDFADKRPLYGIPSFADVATNLPILIAGVAGLIFLFRERGCIPGPRFRHIGETIPYGLFFAAVLLTSLGSAYYHLAPDNGRLAWDRLPLSLVFVSLLAAALAERVDRTTALVLLLPLAILAINTVIYWNLTEARGLGDLRPYLAVQIAPMLVIPALMALFPPAYDRSRDLGITVGIYALAKLCEHLDREIFEFGGIVSGHSLKHCLAALAIHWIHRMLRQRRALS